MDFISKSFQKYFNLRLKNPLKKKVKFKRMKKPLDIFQKLINLKIKLLIS